MNDPSPSVRLWTWLRRLPPHPLALPFILAFVVGTAVTLVVDRSGFISITVFGYIAAPLLVGLLTLVPRIGGALSLGASVGVALGFVLTAIFTETPFAP